MFFFYQNNKKIKSNSKITVDNGFLVARVENGKFIVDIIPYLSKEPVDKKVHKELIKNLDSNKDYVILYFSVDKDGEEVDNLINDMSIKMQNIIDNNIVKPTIENTINI